MEKINKKKMEEKGNLPKKENGSSICNDVRCHIHGRLKVRGRIFEGRVTKKFPTRVAIEFERMIYVSKYERYLRSKTKIHAKLTKCMESEINVGDLIQIQECRPISKIIHFVVIKKLKNAGER
jgi:small subunit ribosomal protein S17